MSIVEDLARAIREGRVIRRPDDAQARACAQVIAKRLREAIEDQGAMLGMENAWHLVRELEAASGEKP